MGKSFAERKAHLARILQANANTQPDNTPARTARPRVDLSQTPVAEARGQSEFHGPVQIHDSTKLVAATEGAKLAAPNAPDHEIAYLAAQMCMSMEKAGRKIAARITPPRDHSRGAKRAHRKLVRGHINDATQVAAAFIKQDLESTPNSDQLARRRDSIRKKFPEAAKVIATHASSRRQRHIPTEGEYTPSPIVRRAASASKMRLQAQQQRTPLGKHHSNSSTASSPIKTF
jgi:hypothetical protein